ncbi:hypothetical protein M0R72_21760 [Candidatus Pacearchaeota archaeon]|jgi:hypothetical protein|nr:hypothetical protein [Candidatus Pacearchaeota archaeon]
MSRDNPDDIELGIETRIGNRVFKTADPPQCTGCEHVNAENRADADREPCISCSRIDYKTWCDDKYRQSGPDEPDERTE